MAFDFGLSGVHVLITGAAGGIGIEVVKTFHQLGAHITAQYNSNIGELQSFSNVNPLRADVRNEKDVEQLLADAESKYGPVAVLIVNHGIWPTNDTPIVEMEASQFTNTIAVNLTGPFLLCRSYLRGLRTASDAVKSVASIVFVGSTAGKFGEAGHCDYAASKSALMYGMTLTLKNEIVAIAPQGRVNCVSPGWVGTAMVQDTLKDKAFVQRALASTPLQKVASPSDVAKQIAVVASPVLSGHISGVNIQVDGGFEGRLLFPPAAT